MSNRSRDAGSAKFFSKNPPSVWLRRVAITYYQSVRDFLNDSGPQWAAAIAYYSLLSIFPLLLAAVSIASFFVDGDWAVVQATQLLGEFVPRGTEEIQQVVEDAMQKQESASILSILALLWTGTRVFGVVTKALNIAFDADETYGFFKRTLVEVVMLFTVGLFFILALISSTILNFLSSNFRMQPMANTVIFQLLIELVPALLLLISFLLIYRFVPRRKPTWFASLLGAITATLLFLLARPLFIGYVKQFANYNIVYGSLVIAIILILWAWIVAVIMLFGGEVSSHVEEIIVRGRSAKDVEHRHLQRSPVRRRSTKREG